MGTAVRDRSGEVHLGGAGPSPVRAFVPRVVLAGAVLWFITATDPDPALGMLLIGFAGVFAIVTDVRFGFERSLEDRQIPSREAWVPILVLAALIGLGYVTGSEALRVMEEKVDVIAFILSFALVADGLGRCGFFQFLAFRITERCHGNTTRLILYLFLLASILTYLTSNDIVILTMTPIVMAVAYHSRMANAKLLLLSQFVAANTVSMGLLIGSPTNLILGRATGLNFIEYFFLMLVPSVVALLATFIVLTWLHESLGHREWRPGGIGHRLFGTWDHAPSYATPQFAEHRTLTLEMRRWLRVFGAAVLVLAVTTALEVSLFWAAIPIAVGSLAFLAHEELDDRPRAKARAAGRSLRNLPYGIVFFGLAFFVLADGIAQTDWVGDEAVPFMEEHSDDQTPMVAWSATFASGALVNVINDLPASALAGEVLADTDFDAPADKALVLQGTLVGLNTGTYVTPIGALAGLIWFDILRRERRRYATGETGVARDILTPSRRDMVAYGLLTFVASSLIIGAATYGFVAVADILLGPIDDAGHFDPEGGRAMVALLCASLLVIVPLSFRRLLQRHNVVLSHMADLFVVLTRLRVMAARHRVAYSIILALAIFLSAGTLLYWAEHHHATQYGVEPAFRSIGGFIVWLSVFVGSGFDNSQFPRSVLGAVLAAMLALGSIAAVLFVVKVSSSESDETLRSKIAKGLIPTDRLVIFHASDERVGLARAVLARPGRFVVAIGAAHESRDLRLVLDADHRDRAAFVEHAHSISNLVRDYDLGAARELVLMSTSKADDFENLSLLLEIDRLSYVPDDDPEEIATQPLPRILVECAMPAMEDLLERSLSGPILDRIRTVQLSDRFGEYLLAENHHAPDRLSAYYGGHLDVEAAAAAGVVVDVGCPQAMVDHVFDAVLAPVRAAGEGVEAPTSSPGLDRRHPWLVRHVVDQQLRARLADDGLEGAPLVGVLVEAGSRIERLSLVAYSAVAARGPILGATVLRPASEADRAEDDALATELVDVVLVNGTSLAEQTASALLAGGARDLTYLVHEHARVPAELNDHPELTVVRVASEAAAAAALFDRSEPETRIVLFDDEDDALIASERLLEQLSAWRLVLARAGRPAPTLIVQCLGEARREHLIRFVADEVIDTSWIDRSFFEVLVRVYLDLILADAVSAERAFRAAAAVASYLASFDVHEVATLELQGPSSAPLAVVGHTLAEVAELGSVSMELVGPVVGLARISIVDGGVHLRVISPLEDEVVVSGDLLLVAPHI